MSPGLGRGSVHGRAAPGAEAQPVLAALGSGWLRSLGRLQSQTPGSGVFAGLWFSLSERNALSPFPCPPPLGLLCSSPTNVSVTTD